MAVVWSLSGPSQRATVAIDARTATETATGTDDVEVAAMSAMSVVNAVTSPAIVDIDAALAAIVLIAIAVVIVAVIVAVTAVVTADAAVTVTRDHRPEATASTQNTHVAILDRQSATADRQLTNAPDQGHDRQRGSVRPDLHALAIAARQRTPAAVPRQRAMAMATDTEPTATRQRAHDRIDPQATERTVPMATRMDTPMAVRRWRTATTNRHTWNLTSAHTNHQTIHCSHTTVITIISIFTMKYFLPLLLSFF